MSHISLEHAQPEQLSTRNYESTEETKIKGYAGILLLPTLELLSARTIDEEQVPAMTLWIFGNKATGKAAKLAVEL